MELVSRLTRQSAAAETSGHLTHGPGNTLFRFYVCRELGQTTSYLNFKELNRFLSKRVPMLKRSLPYAGRGPSPSTHKRTRFPPHPSLRLWMGHPSRWKVNPCLSDDILCAYLDDAIAPKDAVWVSEHMAECATCAVRLRELGQMVKLMGAALDAEISKDAPTDRLRARFKAFLNEASEPFAPAKTVTPSLLNFAPGSAPHLLEWLGGSFRRLAFASVMVVSIAIVVTLAIGACRSGLLKTGSGEKSTQAVNSTDSTNSQAQTPDQV